MNSWIERTREILNLDDKQEFFKLLAKSHIEFERIHPFNDGNGRTGRMIMVYIALHVGHLPPVIPATEKKRYLEYLRKEDFDSFGEWLFELSEIEDNRLMGFRGY
jgi:Fic family protein